MTGASITHSQSLIDGCRVLDIGQRDEPARAFEIGATTFTDASRRAISSAHIPPSMNK